MLALAAPVVVTIFLQPVALVSSLAAALDWIPLDYRTIVADTLLLSVNLLIFAIIFLLCLRIIRPLDAEDIALLNQVPERLRRILLPFASGRGQRARVAAVDAGADADANTRVGE